MENCYTAFKIKVQNILPRNSISFDFYSDSKLRVTYLLANNISSALSLSEKAVSDLMQVDLCDNMSIKRKVEIILGRIQSNFLCVLFSEPESVFSDKSGRPIFPGKLNGSISHTDNQLIVAICFQKQITSIGVDIENWLSFEDAWLIRKQVCNDSELLAVSDNRMNFEMKVTLIFSAKESIYKAFSKYTKEMIDFDEVQVIYNRNETLFFYVIGHLSNEILMKSFTVKYSMYEKYVQTCIVV